MEYPMNMEEPGSQTPLPDNNLVLASVNDTNSFMTTLCILIISVFHLKVTK